MEIRVINWNIGGAKYFEEPNDNKRRQFKNELNKGLKDLIRRNQKPDVITLQEIVEYKMPQETSITPILDIPKGYSYCQTILIDSIRHPYVSKWWKIIKTTDWPEGSYFGQGNAILWKTDFLHFPVWEVPTLKTKPDGKTHIEEVILMSGLYFGDRNTEPRAALVAHFMIVKDDKNKELKHPLDVFIVNLHLTTLMGEREGIPELDEKASKLRLHQLEIITNGIVSRYNLWRKSGYSFRGEKRTSEKDEDFKRYSPIWIICGDFNFTPESVEHARMDKLNFIDVHTQRGTGTKGKGMGKRAKATLTCDYIFAGPKFISLDPSIMEVSIRSNPAPDYTIHVSDHYPLIASIPLTRLGL